jgi:exopolyphosphatase/guanosine-5'-triphosphate,3'-diphosphate pyrophosphatase
MAVSMNTAILDLGTNTFNLLVRSADGALVFSDKIAVRLGAGGLRDGVITPEAADRAVAAVAQHLVSARAYGAARSLAFATSAMRSTANGADLADRIERETGQPVNVIDGDQEAAFIAEGVGQAWPELSERHLIMDIGGGSTEFIVREAGQNLWYASYPLGVTRLAERFLPSDPTTSDQWTEIDAHVNETLEPLWAALERFPCEILLGSSGSFDTLYNVTAHRIGSPELALGQARAEFALDAWPGTSRAVQQATTEARLLMPGMLAMRAETLHLSARQIDLVLARLNARRMLLSGYALKEGVWSSIQDPNSPWRAYCW